MDGPSADRGTTDDEPTRVPTSVCEPTLAGRSVSPKPWFLDLERRPHPFQPPVLPWGASAKPMTPLDLSTEPRDEPSRQPSSRLRKASARCLETKLAIDERNVCPRTSARCARFDRAGPQRWIRRAPLRMPVPFHSGGCTLWRRSAARPLAGGAPHDRRARTPQPAAPSLSESHSDRERSIRP